MRISIIGHAGSGKSTLASNISKKLAIPYLQIDTLWFEVRGHRLKKDDISGKEIVRSYIRKEVEKFVIQDSWVSDGWYSRVQPLIAERADEIVFLNIPLFRRLINHLQRMFFSKRRKDLTLYDDLIFIYQIFRRTFKFGPAMRKFIEKNINKVKVLHNYREVKIYLDSL